MFDGTRTFALIAVMALGAVVLSCLLGHFWLAFWMSLGLAAGLRVSLMTCNSLEARDRKDYNKSQRSKRGPR